VAASRVFQAFEKMRVTAGLSLVENLFRTLLAGGMLWRIHHATASQWAYAALLISVFAVCAALGLVAVEYGRPEFSARLLRQRTGEGFIFALSYSTGSIYNDVDKAMLGHYGMNMANGIYTMAYRVVDVCTIPIVTIHGAAFPRFFRKGAEGVASTKKYAARIVKRTAPLGLLLAATIFVISPVIPHLVGKSFSESVLALRWLCLLPLFRSFQLSGGDAITSAGHQKLRLVSQALAAGFNFCINLYLIPLYSWRGAAWSSLATDGLLGVLNWTLLWWLASKPKMRQS
jgi:O-antigen/teichoic acid export membrane protein